MDIIARLGARGSPLSLRQSGHVQAALAAAAGAPVEAFPLTAFTTSGDRIQDRRLLEAGGKGLFTKELDEALLDGRIDIAIHSLKDLPTQLPAGLILAGLPKREDPRDAFISLTAARLADLPAGAAVGTASLRRQAQTLHLRPDLTVDMLRGNVDTRLKRIEEGRFAATYLALGGLNRLGLASHARSVIDPQDMPPAPGQGALALVCRAHDAAAQAALGRITDQRTELEIAAERAFLGALDGSCHTPIAALARVDEAAVVFVGEVLTPDGRLRWREEARLAAATPARAAALGAELAGRIRERAGDSMPSM
jgi:hydroxymethylbilane synthase